MKVHCISNLISMCKVSDEQLLEITPNNSNKKSSILIFNILVLFLKIWVNIKILTKIVCVHL